MKPLNNLIKRTLLAAFACLSILPSHQASAQNEYLQMSLEELMNVPVSSVSKSESTLSHSPAAIYVLTSEDIRRSAATSLPELLRAVPGIQVAQMNGNRWAITSRGFNYALANKLLVLIDGRTVYSPVFSGVLWEEHDLIMDDIERIEVIRGPGAAIWGANAVNGVINIITKSAEKTKSGLLSASAGTVEHTSEQVRYGGALDDKSAYRLYARYYNRGPLESTHDSAEGYSTGLRYDSELSDQDELMLQSHAQWLYSQQSYIRNLGFQPWEYQLDLDEKASDFHTLGRWRHKFSGDSVSEALLYFDHADRLYGGLEAEVNTVNLDLHHDYRLHERIKVIYGLGYRGISDSFDGSEELNLNFTRDEQYSHLASAFLHSEFGLIPDRLTLTLGTRLENNTYTGFEWEPNARLSYEVSKNHTLWAAASRAVRMPSRINDSLNYNLSMVNYDPGSGLPVEVLLNGSHDFDSENVAAYELGYRGVLSSSVSVDTAMFFNHYTDVETIEAGGYPTLTDRWTLLLPSYYDNMQKAETWGLETSMTFSPSNWLRLRLSHSLFEMNLYQDPLSQNVGDTSVEGIDPDNQIKGQLSVDLPYNSELDLFAYYVSSLPNLDIERYFRFDSRLAVKITPDLCLSLILQNLLDHRHHEFGTSSGLDAKVSEIPRAGLLKLDYRF